MKKINKLLAASCVAFFPLHGNDSVVIRGPESYFQSIQYNWTGEYVAEGKKIPGNQAECFVRGVYHPLGDDGSHKDPFSIVDFKVLAGNQFNPVRFKTIKNIVYITSGEGSLLIYDDSGSKVVAEHPLSAHYSIVIPPMTKHSYAATCGADLHGLIVSSPAWFKEDEEYEWDLVREIFP